MGVITNLFEYLTLDVCNTATLIVCEMVGCGILAMPRAIINTGLIGILIMIVCCINAAYCGHCLGKCWTIIESRYPEYLNAVRKPYTIIALKSIGPKTSYLVSVSIVISLFGAAIVYLLLVSQITTELLQIKSNFCYCLFGLATILTPIIWLGSSKNLHCIGFVAVLTTFITCILIMIQIIIDYKNNDNLIVIHNSHNFNDFFLGFGMIIYAFGGIATFPTIQNDMINKQRFSASVLIAFSIILILYIPISFGGYYVYGERVNINILLSLKQTFIVRIATIFMGIHLVFAFIIIIDPVCQVLEELLRIPNYFCKQRCFLRTILMLLIIFIAATIPDFGKILALIGGSTVILLTFVLPPICYIKLCQMSNNNYLFTQISSHEKAYMIELIIVSIIGGIVTTYSALVAIVKNYSMNTPCHN